MNRPQAPVETYVVRLNGRVWGICIGFLSGLALFVATNVLVLKGGPDMGQHLGLLGHYFPGYTVSFLGSILGFVYAFVCGYAVGRILCLVYNRAAR